MIWEMNNTEDIWKSCMQAYYSRSFHIHIYTLKVKIELSYYTVTIFLLDHRLINKIPSARNGFPLSELWSVRSINPQIWQPNANVIFYSPKLSIKITSLKIWLMWVIERWLVLSWKLHTQRQSFIVLEDVMHVTSIG